MKKQKVKLTFPLEGNYIVKGYIVSFTKTDEELIEVLHSESLPFEEVESFLKNVLGISVVKEEEPEANKEKSEVVVEEKETSIQEETSKENISEEPRVVEEPQKPEKTAKKRRK